MPSNFDDFLMERLDPKEVQKYKYGFWKSLFNRNAADSTNNSLNSIVAGIQNNNPEMQNAIQAFYKAYPHPATHTFKNFLNWYQGRMGRDISNYSSSLNADQDVLDSMKRRKDILTNLQQTRKELNQDIRKPGILRRFANTIDIAFDPVGGFDKIQARAIRDGKVDIDHGFTSEQIKIYKQMEKTYGANYLRNDPITATETLAMLQKQYKSNQDFARHKQNSPEYKKLQSMKNMQKEYAANQGNRDLFIRRKEINDAYGKVLKSAKSKYSNMQTLNHYLSKFIDTERNRANNAGEKFNFNNVMDQINNLDSSVGSTFPGIDIKKYMVDTLQHNGIDPNNFDGSRNVKIDIPYLKDHYLRQNTAFNKNNPQFQKFFNDPKYAELVKDINQNEGYKKLGWGEYDDDAFQNGGKYSIGFNNQYNPELTKNFDYSTGDFYDDYKDNINSNLSNAGILKLNPNNIAPEFRERLLGSGAIDNGNGHLIISKNLADTENIAKDQTSSFAENCIVTGGEKGMVDNSIKQFEESPYFKMGINYLNITNEAINKNENTKNLIGDRLNDINSFILFEAYQMFLDKDSQIDGIRLKTRVIRKFGFDPITESKNLLNTIRKFETSTSMNLNNKSKFVNNILREGKMFNRKMGQGITKVLQEGYALPLELKQNFIRFINEEENVDQAQVEQQEEAKKKTAFEINHTAQEIHSMIDNMPPADRNAVYSRALQKWSEEGDGFINAPFAQVYQQAMNNMDPTPLRKIKQYVELILNNG